MLIEDIALRLSKSGVKQCDWIEYLDKMLDIWNIDIEDNYLDEVVDEVKIYLKTRKERQKTEEYQTQMQLQKAERKYDKIFKDAICINTCITSHEITVDFENNAKDRKEWENILNKIDNLHMRESMHESRTT